jgi:nitroimidazol reductase NimA-like FMN-containing flavoprotein (pyridoxamine 5'-phosphate oxidase superfamily)
MLGELNDQQIEDLLREAVIGRIGCHVDDRTYIVPISYAYDGEAVYGHSASGTKVRMMRANPSVCFEVEHVDDLANWRSVIAWGSYEELTGEAAAAGMQALLTRFTPLLTSATAGPRLGPDGTPLPPSGHTAHPGHAVGAPGHDAVLFRIRLAEKTGRFEKR